MQSGIGYLFRLLLSLTFNRRRVVAIIDRLTYGSLTTATAVFRRLADVLGLACSLVCCCCLFYRDRAG